MERDHGEGLDLQQRVSEAVIRARGFLEAAQLANGRWLDFRTPRLISSFWVTAYVGARLARAEGSPSALAKARTFLLLNQHPSGGWGYSAANPPDADTIANVIHFLGEVRGEGAHEETTGEVVRLLARYWVESEGGFQTYHPRSGDPLRYPGSGWCDPHLSVTAMAGEALYSVDQAVDKDSHRAVLDACARFLRARQCADGLWEDYWWDGRTYSTYHASRLLFLMGDREPVKRACVSLLEQAEERGGWGNCAGGAAAPFHAALVLGTLLLDQDPRYRDFVQAGIAWLLGEQQPDGGFTAVPILRVPTPDMRAPWDSPTSYPVIADANRLFTTATVLSAFVDYLAGPNG